MRLKVEHDEALKGRRDIYDNIFIEPDEIRVSKRVRDSCYWLRKNCCTDNSFNTLKLHNVPYLMTTTARNESLHAQVVWKAEKEGVRNVRKVRET